MKIIFIFSCSGMFQDVPEGSGMFHVPGFIDAPESMEMAAHYSSSFDLHFQWSAEIF